MFIFYLFYNSGVCFLPSSFFGNHAKPVPFAGNSQKM